MSTGTMTWTGGTTGATRGDETGYTTDLITKYAVQFIDDHVAQPFFCYIPHEAVHGPLQLKRSDLREFCEKLDTELGIAGQWDYVRSVVSPTTGNRLGDVAQLRCDRRQEFDVYAIDPDHSHFEPLVYAAYIYSLDKEHRGGHREDRRPRPDERHPLLVCQRQWGHPPRGSTPRFAAASIPCGTAGCTCRQRSGGRADLTPVPLPIRQRTTPTKG